MLIMENEVLSLMKRGLDYGKGGSIMKREVDYGKRRFYHDTFKLLLWQAGSIEPQRSDEDPSTKAPCETGNFTLNIMHLSAGCLLNQTFT